ncbi:radical SAM/SPASM domain-containing protein [Streptomyces acidiscabies]|uniref:Radical SAM protein n=1 Tax=Streptomyces acidiscabies TaxID=42234 RepID=A0AAP6B780_9ACTN|nr:radical SAM protein [Streptomyces acidiscabies]MBP5939682.1 radical SAM protein [Streptomyces sp. LBUM 1476]MBZ3910856.1 radical SAM protein [Streptomyces acidiscabies]MDX2959364.1 radical SAM protein [Streptomyces acidiscabies]MDX3017492.1 radical SAM protein [Streptomyces acidiscabies]MDX3787968.1 radical SAM protein [Streptomyces acidiscabies]
MTTLIEPPAVPSLPAIRSLELEITGKCQLTCTHCLSESGPQATHGTMTPEDWRAVIVDAAALGIETIQLIGGEPTVHPQWREFTELGLSLGLRVEVYSNLFHVAPDWWELFERDGVTLATSYYSDDPAEHDKVTGRKGSYARTRCNIREAVTRGITLRAGIVDILPGQRVTEAVAELKSMGVEHIKTDRVRAVGRAALPGTAPSLDELCGKCTRGRAAVLPNGALAGCVLSRDFPVGNVRETRLADLLGGKAWSDLAALIPAPRAACQPNDSDDCDPASTPSCDPQ